MTTASVAVVAVSPPEVPGTTSTSALGTGAAVTELLVEAAGAMTSRAGRGVRDRELAVTLGASLSRGRMLCPRVDPEDQELDPGATVRPTTTLMTPAAVAEQAVLDSVAAVEVAQLTAAAALATEAGVRTPAAPRM
jgi:hypothetical protein